MVTMTSKCEFDRQNGVLKDYLFIFNLKYYNLLQKVSGERGKKLIPLKWSTV